MTFSSDPQFDRMMADFMVHDGDPAYAYPDSDDSIIKELKAWVSRREIVYRELLEWNDQSFKLLQELMKSPGLSRYPGYINNFLNNKKRAKVRKIEQGSS